jgi:DNA-binding NarL/FixJ family response regulator
LIVIMKSRLTDLLITFSLLHRDGQALIGQIRGSLHELRALRDELRRDRLQHPANGEVPRRAYLQFEYGLTTREAEVALLLAEGRSNTAIAAELGISTHTARHHTQRVLAKLGVHSRAAAGAVIRT